MSRRFLILFTGVIIVILASVILNPVNSKSTDQLSTDRDRTQLDPPAHWDDNGVLKPKL